jgi:hypothetical protein
MRLINITALVAGVAMLLPHSAAADEHIAPSAMFSLKDYSPSRFVEHSASIPWEIGGVFVGITALGYKEWDWGNSRFTVNSEGWFSEDTSSFGMDKLGHAYSTYVLTEFFTHGIGKRSDHPPGGGITAAILSMAFMTYVEVFDGFSSDHGFSFEDLAMDGAGAAFSIVRNAVPGLKEKLDFRLEYTPSGNLDGFHPITDYSGQKYLLALKLAGFDVFDDTPLRYIELQSGYYARGFTDTERESGDRPRREGYIAIGINLQELLFGHPRVRKTTAGQWGRTALEYLQVPGVYIATE